MILELQAELQRQQSELNILRQALAMKPSSKPKHSLPDPEKLTGQMRFDTWLPSIRAKLRVDSEAIGDPIAQFYYVYLALDPSVQAMVLPQLADAEARNSWDYNTILDQLIRVYDNPNKVQEAEDRLHSMRQGTDTTIPAYIAKFERTLYEAQGQNWPDVNKISIFRNGLNSTLRSRLSQQLSLPRTYPAFMKVVQQLAGRHSHSQPPEKPSNSSNDPMDIAVLENRYPSAPTSRPPSPRARSISPARRNQYRIEGRCVRCGSLGHWVAHCPLKPQVKAS
jgi:hypothetical protein